MKKRTAKPTDRKLTKKEKKTIEPLYLTYIPIRDRKDAPPIDRAKVYADMDELFA